MSYVKIFFFIWFFFLSACLTASQNSNKSNLTLLNDQAGKDKYINSKNEYQRRASIELISDQSFLTKIALEDDSLYVRDLAAKKLSDQDILYQLVLNDKSIAVRSSAVHRITNPEFLAEIVSNNESATIRSLAAKRITDQNLLHKIAKQDSNENVRKEAVINITNQELLKDFTKPKTPFIVRSCAIRNITDQNYLFDIALKDENFQIRKIAAETINDQNLLSQIVSQKPDPAAINDQNEASQFLAQYYDKQVKIKAISKINDIHLLISIFQDNKKHTRKLAWAAAKRIYILNNPSDKYPDDTIVRLMEILLDPLIIERYGLLILEVKRSGTSQNYGSYKTGLATLIVTDYKVTIKDSNGDILFEKTLVTNPPENEEKFYGTKGTLTTLYNLKTRSAKVPYDEIRDYLLRYK